MVAPAVLDCSWSFGFGLVVDFDFQRVVAGELRWEIFLEGEGCCQAGEPGAYDYDFHGSVCVLWRRR